MPVVTDPQTGVSFFDEGETNPDGSVSSANDEVVSDDVPEPAPARKAPKVERPRFDNPNARRPEAPGRVAIVEDEPVEEPVVDEDPDGTAEAELDAWIASQVEAKVQAATQAVQSTKDKEIAKALKRADELATRMAKLEEELEEAKLEGLSDDERMSFKDAQALERKRVMLDKQAEELAEVLKAQQLELLVGTYGYVGITIEDLEDLPDDPDVVEKYCKMAEKSFLAAGGTKPGTEARRPAPAKPAKPVPAGASARSDQGGDALPLGKQKQFNPNQGIEAMAENLANTPFVNIRL